MNAARRYENELRDIVRRGKKKAFHMLSGKKKKIVVRENSCFPMRNII